MMEDNMTSPSGIASHFYNYNNVSIEEQEDIKNLAKSYIMYKIGK